MTLMLYSFTRSGDLFGNPTSGVQGYRHEIVAGPTEAEWSFIEGEPEGDPVPETGLRSWFDNRFMSKIVVKYKDKNVWSGWVGYMKLTFQGVIYIRDVREITNTVKSHYQVKNDFSVTDDNNVVRQQTETIDHYTEWSLDEDSRRAYGSLEEVLEHGGDVNTILDSSGAPIRSTDGLNTPITSIDLQIQQVLENKGDYKNRELAKIGNEDNPIINSLVIMAFGNAQMANRILLSDGDMAKADTTGLRAVGEDTEYNLHLLNHGDVVSVSTEIRRIVAVVEYTSYNTDGITLLYAGDISDNDVVTTAGVDSPTGAMDRLMELAKLPDLDGNYYDLRIADDGQVTYQKIDIEAQSLYNFYPGLGTLEYGTGAVPSWDARPGMVALIGQNPTQALPGSWLPGNLMYARRVSMREGLEFPALTDYRHTEAEEQQAMWAHLAFMENLDDD